MVAGSRSLAACLWWLVAGPWSLVSGCWSLPSAFYALYSLRFASSFLLPPSQFRIPLSSILDVREVELLDISEIFADGFGPRNDIPVSRQQPFHIQVRHAFNAFLERCAIPAGKIGAAESLFKDQIAGEQCFLGRPIQGCRAGRVSGCVEDAQFEPIC